MVSRITILIALIGSISADWKLYKSRFGKDYSADEDSVRRAVFHGSLTRINAHNLLHDLELVTYRVSLDEFSDMTGEELSTLKNSRVDVPDSEPREQVFAGDARWNNLLSIYKTASKQHYGAGKESFRQVFDRNVEMISRRNISFELSLTSLPVSLTQTTNMSTGEFRAYRRALLGLASVNWELYKSIHDKNYSEVEEQFRRQVFDKNVAIINAHNLRHDLGLTSYRMGLNKFTDMTDEEFEAFNGPSFDASNDDRTGQRFEDELIDVDLPKTVDWRKKGYVTPVKDQGNCGSCWAFAATGSLEGQHSKATGKLVSLSEQNLVDCSTSYGNKGCNGGLVRLAFNYIKKNRGIDTAASYPYTAKDGRCKFKSNSIGARLKDYTNIVSGSEELLKMAVAKVGPIAVTIDASHRSIRLYKNKVYNEPACSSTHIGHAVLVVGYGTQDGTDYWLVKNSWGKKWGMNGYIKMSRNKNNQCGIATRALFPIVV